jgi:hypothetical protein
MELLQVGSSAMMQPLAVPFCSIVVFDQTLTYIFQQLVFPPESQIDQFLALRFGQTRQFLFFFDDLLTTKTRTLLPRNKHEIKPDTLFCW